MNGMLLSPVDNSLKQVKWLLWAACLSLPPSNPNLYIEALTPMGQYQEVGSFGGD